MHVITGGAGFIGSNIAAALAANTQPLAIVDTLGSAAKWQNIARLPLEALVPPENLFAFLAECKKSITAVIHMGAVSSTTEKNADLLIQTNFTLSQNLWNFCAKNSLPFIYASSAATYGGGEHGFEDEFSAEYLAKLRPLNLYGWSKHLFDRWVYAQTLKKNTPPQWAGLKFFNVYGPQEEHKGSQASVIAQIFPLARENKICQLFKSYNPQYADGWQLRDFVWVGDCVKVINWLLANPQVSGLFNVGSGVARSFYDLAKNVYLALGLEPKIEYLDMPEELRAKYQYYTRANINKLRKAGYKTPATSLEDGTRMYVRDYLMKGEKINI
jgi:ADP-L-glycero-D-manno-heptose 6-epimerase